MGTVEIFLNFMIMDANMNVLRRDPDSADPTQVARLNRFWGDESWKQVAYRTTSNLFGYPEKTNNDDLAQAYRERLKQIGGFGHVPDPLPMRTKDRLDNLLLLLRCSQVEGRPNGKQDLDSHLRQISKAVGWMMATNSGIEWTDATWNPGHGLLQDQSRLQALLR